MPRRALALLLTLFFAAPLAAPLAASPRYEVALIEGTFSPEPGIDRRQLEEAAARAEAAGAPTAHLLAQLYAVPDAAAREDLRRRGLDLGDFVAGNAWMAAIPPAELRLLAHSPERFPELRWALPWSAGHKLHPRLSRGDVAEWARDRENPGWLMLFVTLHHDVALPRLAEIAARVGGVAAEPVETLHGGTVWLPERQLAALAESEEVAWVEEGPPPLTATNDGVREASGALPLASPPYTLEGRGVRLFVYDAGGVSPTHETFVPNTGGSRVEILDGSPIDMHATHVAGTAAGDGSGSPGDRGRGFAPWADILSASYTRTPGAVIYFYDNAGDIEADFVLARNGRDADLATASIGSNIANNGYNCSREGDYGVSGRMLDLLVRGDSPKVRGPMILTWAGGNERNGGGLPRGRCGANYGNVPPPSCAKNPIQIGAVNSDGLSMTSFSSWGPCDDGRLKPIVVAPGCETGWVSGEDYVYSSLTGDALYGGKGWCGTSMAAPAAAGIATLFVEDWRLGGFGSAKTRPLPALVKAFLIHTAKDLGQPGPDFTYGYGAADARAMIDTLRAGAGVLGRPNDAVVWGTGSVADGQLKKWRYFVPEGTTELKASLAWDDAAAANYAAYGPVNDLTLQLVSPTGEVFDAFVLSPAAPHTGATRGLDAVDNQEQVLIEKPAPGSWIVRVAGTYVPQGPQSFGLVYSRQSRYFSTCVTDQADFESGDDLFDYGGATRGAAPGTGHGAFALELGGEINATEEAWRKFTIPAGAGRATLHYDVFTATEENAGIDGWGFGFDAFLVQIRDLAGNVLAVVDNRNDGWTTGVWMRHGEIDLTPYQGTTVKVLFRSVNNGWRPTTWWVDEVTAFSCLP